MFKIKIMLYFFLINIMADSTVINILIQGTASFSGCFFNFNRNDLDFKIENLSITKEEFLFQKEYGLLYDGREVNNYLFTWSKELNEELRRECGKKLYEYIIGLKQTYEKCEINILGHSHDRK